MKLKKTLAGASLLTLSTLALTSCGNNRNTNIPYGNLNLDANVAEALNGELSMSTRTYYNKLRTSGNTIVENKIKEALYNKEYKTLNALFYDQELTNEQKNLLIPTKGENKLFELNGTELSDEGDDNLTYIKKNLNKYITSQLSQAIYSTNSAKTSSELKDDERIKKLDAFISSKARIGMDFTKDDLAYTMPTDDSDLVSFDNIKSDTFKKLVSEYLFQIGALYQPENLKR